jgi:hypothetical protein
MEPTRIYGAILLVVAVAVFAVDRKWPSQRPISNRTALMPALAFVGAWLAIIGRPLDAAGTAAAWGWIGAIVAGGIGLLVGVILSLREA